MHAHEHARYGEPRTTPLLTVAEVARRLAVSRATVRRLADAGELPRVAVGGSVRFDASDVESFIRRCKAAALADGSPREEFAGE
jgi:excisionase family DNA binding protein